MSAPKRLHEEGSHSTPSKRPLEDTSGFSGLSGRLTAPVSNDSHLTFETGQDGRLAKLQRIESREVDKRSPLLHRISSSPSRGADYPVTSENRSESRNPRDVRDIKTDSRQTRTEVRDLYSDAKMHPPVSKTENEIRLDNRAGEKEFRSDRGSHSDYSGRETFKVPYPYVNWKETKEHHRGKRNVEPLTDNLDSWRVARHSLQNSVEVANSRAEEWGSSEVYEAVGENKIDMKGVDKFREKDAKKKEEKHRDFGERDKNRNDQRNNMQLGMAITEHKELPKEEKTKERWERERKDAQRDKVYPDKDPNKRGSPSAHENEKWHHEQEMLDGSVRISEQESIASEVKGRKDETWRADRDLKDKRRERDSDMEDKHEQHGKSYDKEIDDGSAEGDGLAERDREAFGNGIQQGRRMLRTRGAPQTPNREPRLRSRARENEGSQGKNEVSVLVYKPGECMQELLKAWKEFEASQEAKNDETLRNYPSLEICIPAEYVTSSNRQVRGAQLWGTDKYTNDSDIFAVLMHTGYCRPTSSPPASIQELRATVRVLPPEEYYTSTLRNNVRSRAWGAGIGCSFSVERCCIVKKGGGTIDLEPRLTYISALEPTLAPVSVERAMTTRSAASNALRQQRFVREVSIQYNLCNEPWLKYSISIVADKGLKKPQYTSARLKKGEVLYFETHSKRFELCYNGENTICNGTGATSTQAPESEQEKRSHVLNGDKNSAERESTIDVFRWSRCKKILPVETMLSTGIPFCVEDLEVIGDNLDWEELQWSQTGVSVAGKTYVLARVHFLAPKKK